MNKRMTIFAGAGASKAVDPDQYPTTVEFFDRLPISVTTNLLFKSVVALLMQDDKNRILDIEIILWELSELLSFCEQVSNQEEFPAWLFFQDRLAPMLPDRTWRTGHLEQMAKSTWSTAARLRDEINAQVYSFYSEVPSSEKLDRTWKPLLENLLQFGCSIELITTNYDVVLEEAISDLDLEFLHSFQVGWD